MKESLELLSPSFERVEPGSPLHAAFAQLSDEAQRAIILRICENYEISEIARELEITWSEADQLIEGSLSSIREFLCLFLDLANDARAG